MRDGVLLGQWDGEHRSCTVQDGATGWAALALEAVIGGGAVLRGGLLQQRWGPPRSTRSKPESPETPPRVGRGDWAKFGGKGLAWAAYHGAVHLARLWALAQGGWGELGCRWVCARLCSSGF